MLRQDFNGYKEFADKIMNTSGEENLKVCVERVQMWADKFMDIINPLPEGGCSNCNYSIGNYCKNTSQK